MTFTTSILARFSRAFRRTAAEAPDYFDNRLQKLSASAARERRQTASVFKNRQSRLAA